MQSDSILNGKGLEVYNESMGYTYDEYKKDIQLYMKTSPFESSYQRVIENVLKYIIRSTEIELVISAEFRKHGTKRHCVEEYKREGTSSPDLMLTKDFAYHNMKEYGMERKSCKEAMYYAYVEVKKPKTIYIQDKAIQYSKHDRKQITEYLAYGKTKKVIFTDCYTWVLYKRGKEFENIDQCKKNIFVLNREGVWENDDVWNSLQRELQRFILEE